MNKKLYSLFLLLLSCVCSAGAQEYLLNEDFESVEARDTSYYSKQFPDGWQVTNSGVETTSDQYTWSVAYYNGSYPSMTGHGWLYVDAPTWDGDPKGGFGPRQEIIETPALDLQNTYQLTFDWKAAPAYVNDYKYYTLKVYAVDQSSNEATLLLDISDEASRKASGVTDFSTWDVKQSKLDLSSYQGKTIRIRFVYDLLKSTGNCLWIDNVKVKQGAALTSPVAQSSISQYKFATMYIGEKHYSEAFTLKNVGANGLKVTGFEAPEGVTLSGDTANINLDMNATAQLQLAYKASLTTPTSGNAVIKTNGGDVTIAYTATKEAVPDGYTLELFEQYPPAGWTMEGWAPTYTAIEGDRSMLSSADYSDMYLTSPRLDLSNSTAPHKLMFTYYNMFYSEEGDTYASNDISVWVSTDGGETWNDSIWTTVYDDLSSYNVIKDVTLDLSKYKSNNVKVRWKNPATQFDDSGAYEYSYFFLDRVLLPNVYGADGLPIGISYTAPADSAKDVFGKSVRFEWQPAQFAESYKLYVGTAEDKFDIINGQDMGNALSYTVASLPSGSTIYWKVQGVNAAGEETDAPVWCFFTQQLKQITSFPWFEGFEDNGESYPLGWYAENVSQYSCWDISSYYPYEGKYIAYGSGRATGDVNRLYSPDIVLPADGEYQLSFWWGNYNAVYLKKDANTVRTNTFQETDNGGDYGLFEIFYDGEWHQLDRISDNSDEDNRYWLRDAFDLKPYAGKTIQLRWTYGVTYYNLSHALCIDNIEIKSSAASAAAFNTNRWDAYKVNYNETATSDTIAIANLGAKDVTINSAVFTQPNFSTTLAAGTTIKAGTSQTFQVSFNAQQTAATDSVSVEDSLVVSLSDGTSLALPVSGIALAKDIQFFGFEKDKTGGVPAYFTGINADGTSTESLPFWTTPNLREGAPLSFCVLNEDECYHSLKCAHGKQALMTRCNENTAADDWLVSQQYTLTDKSAVQFDARSWESVNSVLPIGAPTFKVYVSETSATDTKAFTQVGSDMTPDLYDEVAWNHYSVDLSAYAGKKVYIAIEAVYTNSLGGFLDNVEFDHIDATLSGINSISADSLSDDAPIYNVAGQRVSKSYRGVVLQNGKKYILK